MNEPQPAPPELEPSAVRPPRNAGLDAARALSVMAMVFGHTAEALMSAESRQLPWLQTYWHFRGLTAPVFLFVSGWAVVASISRSELHGRALIKRHLPRVFLLLGIGLMLRLPAWDLWGALRLDPKVWAHWLGFDALHCIAVSLLLGVALFALVRSWPMRAAALLGLVVFVPLLSAAIHEWSLKFPLVLTTAIRSHPQSPFPIFPWSGYFFGGALAGTLLGALERRKWSLAWGIAGLILVGVAMTAIALPYGVKALPRTSAMLFVYRIGLVAIVAAAALLLPRRLAVTLGPVGRSALVVYVAHLPLVYGWAIFPGLRGWLGPVLTPGEVALLATMMLVFGLTLAYVIRARPWQSMRAWWSRPAVAPQ